MTQTQKFKKLLFAYTWEQPQELLSNTLPPLPEEALELQTAERWESIFCTFPYTMAMIS